MVAYLVVIPSEDIDIQEYNNLLLSYNLAPFTNFLTEKRLTTLIIRILYTVMACLKSK